MKRLFASLIALVALCIAVPSFAATADKSYSATLTLLSTTTVDFTTSTGYVQVHNRSSTDVWVRLDGTNPAVNQDGSYVVVGGSSRLFAVVDSQAPTIKLYTAVAATVSVEIYPPQ